MRKVLLVALTAIVTSAGALAAPAAVNLPKASMIPENLKFDQGTYAAISLPAGPFLPALHLAEDKAGARLQSRGEAHLTVLTPPEYMRMDPKMRAAFLGELKALDWKSGIQIKPVCIGRGQASLNGKDESAYFLVVDAPGVRAVREKYHLVDFYPHITLGFTKRDLHFEDGVKKDRSSCVGDVALQP